MPATEKSQKTQAPQGQGAKAGLDQPTAPVMAKLTRSWLNYVKDLPGAEKAGGTAGQKAPAGKGPIVGDDTAQKAPAKGPNVGADTPAKLRDEPQPTTVHDGKKYETKYGDFGTKVFDNGAELNDIQQGYLGDCFLVAAMGAVAMQRPELIEKMIKDNGDGTATVTLYTDNGAVAVPGEGKAVEVRISMKLPTTGGSPAYARAASKELWPSLIEKAYVAQFAGGDYQNANNGGSPGDAMTAMLGKASTGFSATQDNAKTTISNLETMVKGGKPVVAASFGKDATKGNEGLKKLADEKNVHAWHAYIVKSADEKANSIELFNPWGSSQPEKLTAEDFQKLYTWVYVGNPKPPEKVDPATK